MGRMLTRLIALAVVGIAVYRGLHMLGVLGGSEDTVEFEWAEDPQAAQQ